MNSPIEVEIANSRRTVWAAKSTPSTVASNGPITKITVVPARVKTLTRIDRDGDRQGQQERGTGQPPQHAGTPRQHEHDRDDDDRSDVAAEQEGADREDRRDDRLGQRVEPVIRARGGRNEPGDEGRILRLEVVGPDEPGRRRRVYSASRPNAFSPCGNRATNRRDRVWSRTKTMKNVSVLSIGSERSPCWRTAVWRSEPACWKAATRRSVPDPVTPPKTTGRDRRRDDRRHDPADEPGDRHIGDADVAADDEQDDEPDDRRDDADRDRCSRSRTKTGEASRRVAEEREVPPV